MPPSAERMSIDLLGEFRVTVDDVAVRFSAPPRTVPLLAYLAIQRAKPVPRETIAGTLWPDVSDDEARANLRRHLHYLANSLPATGKPWTVGDRRDLQWNPGAPVRLDIEEFERLCGTAQTRVRAIDVYAGDLLEAYDEEWLSYERARLRSMQLSALELLIAEAASAADAPRTIAFARRLLQTDPWREDAIRALVLARYRMGDRAGALADYRRFAQMIKAELGIDPMPETVACYNAIVREQPPSRVEESFARGRAAPPIGTLPLAGRAQQYERLRTLWSRAYRGRGSLILLGGEAGIGKTRLTQELALEAERAGFVAVGHSAVAEPVPYHTLADAVRLLPLGDLSIDPLSLSVLDRIVPELRAHHARIAPAPKLDPQAEQVRLFEAFATLLGAAARQRPLLLILEDIHWCGAAMMSVIEYLTRRLSQLPILLIATYREEEIGATHPLRTLRRRLGGETAYAHLALSNLDAETVEMLIRLVSNLGAEARPLARHLFAVSDGNPLFLVETLRDLVEAEQVVVADERWSFTALADAGVPRGARTAIVDRLARLSPEAYALAEIAAVVGRGFGLELVTAVSGWSEGAVVSALDELLDRQILRDSGGQARAEYAFTHHLIQTAVYENAAPEKIIGRHRRIAGFLERLAGDDLDDAAAAIAYHCERAQEPDRAAALFCRAARYALAVGGTAEAVALASRGLVLSADDALRFELLRTRQEAARRELRRAEQFSDLAAMLAISERTAERQNLCEVLLLRANFFDEQEQDQHDREIARLEQEATALQDARWLAEVSLAWAERDTQAGRYADARSHLARVEQSVATLTATDIPLRLAWAQLYVAFWSGEQTEGEMAIQRIHALAAGQGYAAEVRALRAEIDAVRFTVDWVRQRRAAAALIELCAQAGDRAGRAYGHMSFAIACSELYDLAESRRHFDIAETLYGEIGQSRYQVMVLEGRSALEGFYGTPESMIVVAERCEELARSIDYGLGAAIGAHNLSAALRLAGRIVEAKLAALRAIDYATRINNQYVLGPSWVALGCIEREHGEHAVAVEHAERGVAIEREINALYTLGQDLFELTITYAAAGMPDRAAPIAEEALQLYDRYASRVPCPQLLLWAAALSCRASGDAVRSLNLVAQARQTLEAIVAQITDADAKTGYLRYLPNAAIVRAAESDEWPFSLTTARGTVARDERPAPSLLDAP